MVHVSTPSTGDWWTPGSLKDPISKDKVESNWEGRALCIYLHKHAYITHTKWKYFKAYNFVLMYWAPFIAVFVYMWPITHRLDTPVWLHFSKFQHRKLRRSLQISIVEKLLQSLPAASDFLKGGLASATSVYHTDQLPREWTPPAHHHGPLKLRPWRAPHGCCSAPRTCCFLLIYLRAVCWIRERTVAVGGHVGI